MVRLVAVAAALGGILAFPLASPQAHHNDWAAPLVGGALGGYALSSLVDSARQRSERSTTYVTPAPTYIEPVPSYVPVTPTPSTASIEAQLRQLDQLAAGGYITQQEYQARRTAILNEL